MSRQFYHRLFEGAKKRGLSVYILGEVSGSPIYFLASDYRTGPLLLIAAGFHGDEPAACWGLLDFIENAPDRYFTQATLSFLPVVNPYGFAYGEHGNILGNNVNRGFPTGVEEEDLSEEGEVLLKNYDLLRQSASDGFLTLHEDTTQTEFYLYNYEAPGDNTSTKLLDTAKEFFSIVPDGLVDSAGMAKDGVIFSEGDAESFEILLFLDGVARSICTETPGRAPTELRVEANRRLIEAFIDAHSDESTLRYASAIYRLAEKHEDLVTIPDGAIKVNLPDVRQETSYSCGAASLMAVARYYGLDPMSEEEDIVDLTGMDHRIGSHPNQLLNAAEKLGLKTDYVEDMSTEELKERLDEKKPVLLTLQAYGKGSGNSIDYSRTWKEGHWVVAIGYDDTGIFFEDPSMNGIRGYLTYKELDKRWHDIVNKGKKKRRVGIAMWVEPEPKTPFYDTHARRMP